MWLNNVVRALFGERQPAPAIGPQTVSGSALLGGRHAEIAQRFGVKAIELTEMWPHEVRLNRPLAQLASGVDALARPAAGASCDRWLVSAPGDSRVLGVVGRYVEGGKEPRWVAADTTGSLMWRSDAAAMPTMQRGGWPEA